MSKPFIDRLRERVEAEVAPLRKYHGDNAPEVRMALTILEAAEEIQAQLMTEKVPTDRAAELTGWNPQTLQRRAKAKLAGEEMPGAWAELEVEPTGTGYLFVVGSIPTKVAA